MPPSSRRTRTLDSQSRNRGSNPLGGTRLINKKMKIQKFFGKYLDVFLETDKNKKIREKVYLKDSVNILISDTKGDLYLLKEKRWEKNGQKVIKLISGLVENDEKPIDAAKREMKEELGLDIKRWKKVFVYNQKGTVNQRRHYYLAFMGKMPENDHIPFCKYTKAGLRKTVLNDVFSLTTSGAIIKFLNKIDNIK